MPISDNDDRLMGVALALARRGAGRVAPNPMVGCVIVTEDGPQGGTGVKVLGRGWTQPGGRPHAETEALAQAGAAAKGATAYVTLEPCAHHGQTPPCAEALTKAGIARAVVAVRDTDPRVAGKGIAHLQDAGVEVTEGVCAEEAQRMNAGYFSRIKRGRPWVQLKVAASLDGRIALPGGQSRWITKELARDRGQLMRAMADAILIGIGTALADDPLLSVRLPGLEDRSPIRVVMDSQLRLDPKSQLVRTAKEVPLVVVTGPDAPAKQRKPLEAAGAEVISVSLGSGGHVDPTKMLDALGKRGLTRLLVEGGSRLSASLIGQGLVDEICWFTAPKLLGGDGIPAIAALGLTQMDDVQSWRQLTTLSLGDDSLTVYEAV